MLLLLMMLITEVFCDAGGDWNELDVGLQACKSETSIYNLVDENEGKKNDAEAGIYEFHVFVLGNGNHACQGLACTWAIRSLKHAKKKKSAN